MDPNRRSTRHLEPKDDSSRSPTVNSFRASTVDSGRGSMVASERSTTLDSRAADGASSTLSRDTPLDSHEDTTPKEDQDDRPVRIYPTRVLEHRCYEQAFVSHIDHLSAFFLQLAHFQDKYIKLDKEINAFYSQNSMSNPSFPWKRGDYCIAKYKDGKFYRARIVEVPEVTKTANLYDVVFLDFGNWNKVASIDIHKLLPKFATLTAQAIPCSLTKTLPRSGTWSDHPKAIKLFEDLVFEKYVDATVQPKTSRNYWPLILVDLQLSSNKLNVRERMKGDNLIREVANEEIYMEFSQSLTRVDYIIYSIRHEGEEHDDDDDES